MVTYLPLLIVVVLFLIVLIYNGKKLSKEQLEKEITEAKEKELADIIVYLKFLEKSIPKSKSKSKSKSKNEVEDSDEDTKAKAKEKALFFITKTIRFIAYHQILSIDDALATLTEISIEAEAENIKDSISQVLTIANANKEFKCPFDNCFTKKIETLD